MHALAEAIRFTQQFHNMSMMGQAVEQCGGQTFIAKAFMLPSPLIA